MAPIPEARLDFLKTEYTTSIDLIKYYDGREFELVKFASGLTAAVPTAVFGFYALKSPPADYAWNFIIFISLVTAVSLLSIFLAMVQTRLYFVYPGRQANEMRTYFFELKEPNAATNQTPLNRMYKKTNFTAYKENSAHTLQLVFVGIQTAIFFGVAAAALAFKIGATKPTGPTGIGLGATAIFAGILFAAAHRYLTSREKATADKAVHGAD